MAAPTERLIPALAQGVRHETAASYIVVINAHGSTSPIPTRR